MYSLATFNISGTTDNKVLVHSSYLCVMAVGVSRKCKVYF